MPITINGSSGIVGANGSVTFPALTGADIDTGVFFPEANVVAFSTGSVESFRANANGIFATANVNVTNLNATNLTATNVIPTSSYLRNRIINGDMRIDQRNAGVSVTPANLQYTVDRWQAQLTQTSKFTAQQNAGSVTPPVGYSKYLGITSSSAYSVLTGDYFALLQGIEGFNTDDLAWGTANAKTVTLSFWVRSSLTGTFGGAISGGPQSYPFTYTISSANTWEQKSITIAGSTSGSWATNNTASMYVSFSLGVGTTYSGTAGAWSNTFYFSATGATSVVGTSGATFYVTGVQLEVGTVATPFERQIYGTQLAQCQRYYQQHASSGNGAIFRGLPQTLTSGTTYAWMPFAVVTRAVPTMTVGTPSYTNMSGASWANINLAGAEIGITVTGTNSYAFIPWTASAEL